MKGLWSCVGAATVVVGLGCSTAACGGGGSAPGRSSARTTIPVRSSATASSTPASGTTTARTKGQPRSTTSALKTATSSVPAKWPIIFSGHASVYDPIGPYVYEVQYSFRTSGGISFTQRPDTFGKTSARFSVIASASVKNTSQNDVDPGLTAVQFAGLYATNRPICKAGAAQGQGDMIPPPGFSLPEVTLVDPKGSYCVVMYDELDEPINSAGSTMSPGQSASLEENDWTGTAGLVRVDELPTSEQATVMADLSRVPNIVVLEGVSEEAFPKDCTLQAYEFSTGSEVDLPIIASSVPQHLACGMPPALSS